MEGEEVNILEKFKRFFEKLIRSTDREVVILIDGPNTLRKVNGRRLSLKNVLEQAKKFGRIRIAKAVITTDAPPSLVKALQTSGFEIVLSKENTIYTTLAVEAIKMIYEYTPDVFIIVSRDSRCLPIVHRVKERGIKAIVAGYDPGFATALKNAADEVVYLELVKEE